MPRLSSLLAPTALLLLASPARASDPSAPADAPAAAATDAGTTAAPTEPPPVDPAPTPVVSDSTAKPDAPARPALQVGGGALLWYYQPFIPQTKNNIEVFFANIVLDGHAGNFGLHLEPRFRESKLRPFFAAPVWIQEAYGSYEAGGTDSSLTVKAGKVYSHFGLFWDNSFYGNVQVYDGLKLTPNYGLSLEGQARAGALGGKAYAQYFVIDGHTNVSLPGRETFSIDGAHRRNETDLRLEPQVAFGASTLTLGLSGQYLQADLPTGKHDVFREAADLTYAFAGLTLWGEATFQQGQSVSDFPIAGTPATATTPAIPGQASRTVRYALAGGQYAAGAFTARYVFSRGDYADLDVTETLQVPSVGVSLGEHLALLGELVLWRRHAPGADTWVDRSFNVTLYAHF